MWHILLIFLPFISIKAGSLTEISIEYQRVGRHILNNKVHHFNIYKKKVETNYIIVTENEEEMIQDNLNRLFNPLLKNKRELLSHNNIIPKNCERYIKFTIQYDRESNKIKVCESPYIDSPIHKKIKSWVNFLNKN